jgi:hypothetical protein
MRNCDSFYDHIVGPGMADYLTIGNNMILIGGPLPFREHSTIMGEAYWVSGIIEARLIRCFPAFKNRLNGFATSTPCSE